jgi:hypothetical protein
MIALLCLFLTLFASPFKSKSRLAAENAALRQERAQAPKDITKVDCRVGSPMDTPTTDFLFLARGQPRGAEGEGAACRALGSSSDTRRPRQRSCLCARQSLHPVLFNYRGQIGAMALTNRLPA